MAIIGKIRQRTGLLVFFVALAIICFLLMDAVSGNGGAAPNSIGEVNGMNLDVREYSRRVDQTLSNFQRSGQPIDDAALINAKNSAYNNYVKDLLSGAEYEKLGISMSDDEMNELIYGTNPHPSVKNEPTFQENGVFSPQKVKDYLNSLRESGDIDRARSWNIFKNFLRTDGERKKYSNLINQAMYVPTFLAETKNVEANGTANIEYVKIPYTQIPDTEITVTDSDLRAYLNENKSDFNQDASRAVDYVVFNIDASDIDIANTKKSIDEFTTDFSSTPNADLGAFLSLNSDTKYADTYVSRNDLAGSSKLEDIFAAQVGTVLPTFLENNIYKAIKIVDKKMVADTVEVRHILRKVDAQADDTAAKKTIDSLKTAIQGGYDFAAAASAFSEDSSNSDKGGDLGKVTKGQMVKPFNDLIFYQATQGTLETVKTDFGWHLVQVTKSNPTTEMVKIAEMSKAIIPSTETTSEIFRRATEFAGRNTTESSVKTAAEQMGLPVQNSGDFTTTSTSIGALGASEALINWAFTHDKGDVSDVLEMGNKYVVAVLTSKKEEGLPNIEDVRDRVESAVKNQKKAEKIIAQVSGTDLNAIASQFNTTTGNSEGLKYNFISTGDLGKEPKVIAAAFALKQGETSKAFAGDQGVFVVKNTSMAAPAISDMANFKNTERTKNKTAVDFYAQEALYKNAKIDDARLRNIAAAAQQKN